MPHVSRKQLQDDVSRQIYDQFIKMLANKKAISRDDALDQLLTDTEHIMLAKRFAALYMLAQNVSAYRAHKLLHMSYVTTKRLKRELANGLHPHIAPALKKKKDREHFWAEMEVLVRVGMPEMGKNRWK